MKKNSSAKRSTQQIEKKKKAADVPVAGWRHPPPAKLQNFCCCCRTHTHAHTCCLHPVCLSREWETPRHKRTHRLFLYTHKRALSRSRLLWLNGMLCAARLQVALCALVSLYLPLYLQFPFVQFSKRQRRRRRLCATQLPPELSAVFFFSFAFF